MTIAKEQEGFRLHLAGQGRSPATIRTYVQMIDPFARFLDERRVVDLSAVTQVEVDAYAASLGASSRATQTQRAMLRAVKRFFEYLVAGGKVRTSPAAHLRDPREPRPAAASALSLPAPPPVPAVVLVEPAPPSPPVPEAPLPDPTLTLLASARETDEMVISLGDRRYRIRGLLRNNSFHQLRVNVLLSVGDAASEPAAFHIDTIDLYSSRQRLTFIKHAARELGVPDEVVRHDVGKLLFMLEDVHAAALREAAKAAEPAPRMLTAEEEVAALELLRDPRLLDRIVADFDRCGLVGEPTNKLVAYLAAVSRKLDEPLAVVVQSSSAAGKSSLVEAALAFVPPEDRLKFSAMTAQSLYYLGPAGLKHKLLAVAEEAGARRASYALKLLQSEGELTIASTEKDKTTGRTMTKQYRVEGPVAMMLTTTAIDVDEELLNRCIVLTVGEDRDQTRAIQRVQRERQTLDGLLSGRERAAIRTLHQNAQRLIEPLLVVNQFARELTFSDDRTRARRDQMKYLTLIRTIALLHQHQRPRKTVMLDGTETSYIEVTADDVAVANRLCMTVLGRPLDDLPPHTRNLLLRLDEMVTGECERRAIERRAFRFTRRDVRERVAGGGDTQLKVHFRRLVDAEYLVVHRAAGGRYAYELAWSADSAGPGLGAALVDATTLRAGRAGGGRPPVGPRSARRPPRSKGNGHAHLGPSDGHVIGRSAGEAPTVGALASYPVAAGSRS